MNSNSSPHPKKRRQARRSAIVRAIKAAHGAVEAFARHIQRDSSLVHRVIKGREVSTYVAGAIGEVLGRPPCEIWPRLYAEDGGPRSTAYRRRQAA